MESNNNPIAQRLVESFVKINKLNVKHHSIQGIRPNEFFMLVNIKKRVKEGMPGIKVTELSNILQVSTPTVTQIITGLEKQGYVERNMDKEDRRAVRVNLTDKGNSFMHDAYEKFISSFNGLVEYLGEEKCRTLTELLQEVLVYFNEIAK